MIALLSTRVLTSCSRTTPAPEATVSTSHTILIPQRLNAAIGMSIGSISSGKTVSGVIFSGNTVSSSLYGTRVKVDSDATSGSVSNVTWSGYVLNKVLTVRRLI